MKKTIYFLCALAGLNAAFAQSVTLQQGNGAADAASVGNKATITQSGGSSVVNLQYGMEGQATITQTALEVNDNNISVVQTGNDNNATVDQIGQLNSISLLQLNAAAALTGGNVATITQSGENNKVHAEQATGNAPETPVYGNHLSISQTADNGLIEVYQIGGVGGNNAFLTQESDNSIIRVIEKGSYNSATVNQNGGAYNNVYLELDNTTAATTLGNNATITQTGTGNVFQVKFIGDNNQINVEQVGNNNYLTDGFGTFGIGEFKGSNNTINAIQHGDNLHGWINLEANNSIINVTSIAY